MKKQQPKSQPKLSAFDAYVDRWHHNLDRSEVIDQHAEEFVRLRKSFRHQDETPIILGLSFCFPVDELWAHKRDIIDISQQLTDTRDPELIERGRQAYIKRAGFDLKPCTMRRGDYVASMDGLSEDGTQLLDILPLDGPTKPIADAILQGQLGIAYRMKMEHMMFVSQAKEARIWLYQDDCQGKMTVMRLTPNVVNVTWMLTGWEYFQRHVELGNHPDYDKTGIAEW